MLISTVSYRIRWGKDRMNPFTAVRGDNAALLPFDKLLWTLAINIRLLLEAVTPVWPGCTSNFTRSEQGRGVEPQK